MPDDTHRPSEVNSVLPETVDERLLALIVNRPGGARQAFRTLRDASQLDGWVNQQIFTACQSVFERQKPRPMMLSRDLVVGELQGMGIYDKIDKDVLHRVLHAQIEARDLDVTIDIIKRRKTTAEIDKAIEELTQSASDPTKRIEIASRIADLSRMKDEWVDRKILGLDDWLSAIDHIERMPDCVQTGFPLLDERLGGGLSKGGYHIVASPTGSGKTILMLTMWKHMLDRGVKSIYLNYEIARDLFMKFLFAQFTGINVMRRDNDPMRLEEAKFQFKGTVERLYDENLLLISDPMQGSPKVWTDVEDMLRDLVETHGAEVVFFDTINSVSAATKRGQDARWNEYESIAIASEHFCQELNISVVYSAQMDQNAVKREDKRPQLMDVSGSKTLTEKASSVIHLHRVDLFDPKPEVNYSELHITKNRVVGQEFGKKPIRVMYDAFFKRLAELPPDQQEPVRTQVDPPSFPGTFVSAEDVTGVRYHPQLKIDDGGRL